MTHRSPLFLAAVVVGAWLAGRWPGLATTGLSALALVRFFDLSRASPLPGPEDTVLDLALFVAVASLISWLTANVKSTNRRLDAARRQAEAAARARDELLAAAAHDLIEVAAEDRGNGSRMATVRVCDRGLGIPAAEMQHVFERFFRAANVGTIGGTGIGLAGSRQIIEQHGGTLTAESREGVGSTFTLHLPLDIPTEAAAAPRARAPMPGAST